MSPAHVTFATIIDDVQERFVAPERIRGVGPAEESLSLFDRVRLSIAHEVRSMLEPEIILERGLVLD